MAAGGVPKLLFIGDSLIEYFDWAARFPRYDVYNCGLAGETVRGLEARIDRIVRSVEPPDQIFIMSGINSLAMGEQGLTEAYRHILHALHRAFPKASSHLLSLLPVLFPFIDNQEIESTNNSLSILAREAQAGFIDLYGLFIGHDGRARASYLLDDGVHLSEEGYAVWAAALETLLSPV